MPGSQIGFMDSLDVLRGGQIYSRSKEMTTENIRRPGELACLYNVAALASSSDPSSIPVRTEGQIFGRMFNPNWVQK